MVNHQVDINSQQKVNNLTLKGEIVHSSFPIIMLVIKDASHRANAQVRSKFE